MNATRATRRGAPEKQVQRDVRRALLSMGFDVQDLSQPRNTMLPPGLPDLYARHPGWKLRAFIEVKAPRGRLSEYQERWQELERECGGVSVVVWCVDDLIRELKKMGAPIT